jgi:hypothetical protein
MREVAVLSALAWIVVAVIFYISWWRRPNEQVRKKVAG